MSTTELLTSKKSRPNTQYLVLTSVLGTHQRDDKKDLQPKFRGDLVTTEELGPNCDVERLLALRAITPRIMTPDELNREAELQSHYPDQDDRTLFPARARKPAAPPKSIVDPLGVKYGQPTRGV